MQLHKLTPADKVITSKGYSFCGACVPVTFEKQFKNYRIVITRNDVTPHPPLIYSAQIHCNSNPNMWRCFIYTFGEDRIEDNMKMMEEELLRFFLIAKNNDKIFFNT